MRKVLVALLGVATGCGTLINFKHSKDAWGTNRPIPYGGVGIDGLAMKRPALIPVGLIDMPLSLVADTVTLPYTLWCLKNDRRSRDELERRVAEKELDR